MKKLTPAGTNHHHHHDTIATLPTTPTTSWHDDKEENEHSTTSGSTSDDDDEETSLRGWIRCPKNNKGAGGTHDEEETASIVSELTLATTLLQPTKKKKKKKTKKKAKKNKARKAKSSTSKQSPGEETTPVRPRGAVTKKGLTSVQEDEDENLRVMILQDEEALSEKKIYRGLPPSFGGSWDQGAGSSFRSYSTATSCSLKPPSSNGILTDASPPQPQRKPSLSPPGRSWMSRLAQNSTAPTHAMMPHLSETTTLTHTTTGAGRFALPFKKSTSLRSFDPQGPTYFGTPRPPRGASLLEMTRSNASERSLCRHGAPQTSMLPYYYYPMHHSASSSLSYEDYPSEPFIFHGNHEIAPYQEEDDLLLQSLIVDETEATTTHSSSGPFSVDNDDSFHNNNNHNKPRKATLRGLRKQFQGLKKKLLFRGGQGANDTAAVDATVTSKKEPVVVTPPQGNKNTRKTSTTRPSLRSSMMKRAASLSVLGKGRNVKKTSAAAAAPSRDYCDYYGADPFAFDSEASTATPQVASQKAPPPSKMAMQRSVSSNQVMVPTEKSRRKAFQKSSSIKNKKKPLSAKDLRRCMEEQHNTSESEEEDSKKRSPPKQKKSSKKNAKARKSVAVASTQERGSPDSSLQVSLPSSALDPSRQKPTKLPRAASLNQLGLLVDPDRSIHKDEAPSLPQRKQDHEATPTRRAALRRVDNPPTPPKRSSQKKKKTPKSKTGLSPRGGGASKSKRSTRRIQKPVGMGPSSLGSRSTTSSNREDFDASEQHDLVSPLWSERSSMGSAGSYSKRRLVSVSPNAILPFVLDFETNE